MEAIAPQGWTLGLDNFSLGDVAPSISGFQVFNNSQTGEVESVTADVLLETTTLQVSITGTGPLVGKFVGMRICTQHAVPLVCLATRNCCCSIMSRMVSARPASLHCGGCPMCPCTTAPQQCYPKRFGKVRCVRAVNLKGLTLRGKLQFVPFSSERLMLFSFTAKPELDLKLNIRGRFIGQQSIPQFAFLRAAIIAAVQKDFVEPNRGVIPLEFAPLSVRRRRPLCAPSHAPAPMHAVWPAIMTQCRIFFVKGYTCACTNMASVHQLRHSQMPVL